MRAAHVIGLVLLLVLAGVASAEEVLPDAAGAERFFELLRRHSPLPGDRRASADGPRLASVALSPEESAPEAENLDLLLGTPQAIYLGPRRGRPLPLLGKRFTVYAPIPVVPGDRFRADWSAVLAAVRNGTVDAPEVAAALERLGAAEELSGDARLPYLRGLVAFRAGNPAAASDAFRAAAERGDLVSRKLWAVCRLEAGDPQGAVDALRDAAKEAPDDAVVHALLGESLSRVRRYREAIPALEVAVAKDPGNARARVVLSRSLLLTGDAEGALTAITPVLAGESPALGPIILAARAHLALDRTDAAEPLVARARELAPTSPRGALVEVTLRIQQGRPADALKIAQSCAKKAPKRPDVLRVWTYTAIAAGDGAEAETAARQWMEAAPKRGLPRIGLARALLMQDRAGPASEILLAIRRDHPRLATTESLLGDVYVKLGDPANARKHYEAYLELIPKGPHSERIRGRLSELR